MVSINQRIADELGVQEKQVTAAVELLDGGATVPFVARYRKEATGALDDAQLRTLDERLRYLRDLEERRAAVLASIAEQGKLDAALEAAINTADTKARLEDIYLPFKPKRRTKAQIAREAGLGPLAEALLARPALDPAAQAAAFVNADKGIADTQAALDGARAILVERFSEDADLIGHLREEVWTRGKATSKVRDGKETAGAKFADYFDFSEPLVKLPSHRILALYRGEKEEILDIRIEPEPEAPPAVKAGTPQPGTYERRIAHRFGIADQGRPGDRWLAETVRWAWRTKILVHISVDLRGRLWQAAEDEAVKVFAGNLRDLLLAAPAGTRATMGLDPGFRTGVKVAVVDATSRVVATATIYPHEPQRRWDEAIATLAALAARHKVELVAIGNGTASRETDKLAAELIQRYPDLKLTKVMVSEAGASVYSASAFASQELPDLDVSLRGAVSIARRLQDPLAELVKIDPKSIGVGQYQHDLSESKLSRSLDAVVEDCVNAVGVDVNTASAPLLARVSGVGEGLAQNIVLHRDENGPFRKRSDLKKVARLGPKAFEQAAGFLRIPNGDDPLDASSVHPEAYPVVRRILEATKSNIRGLIGNTTVLRGIQPARFTDETFGLPTVTDILKELEKPGRDPRPAFKTATFREGVEKLSDLEPGMMLEGVVTNVAAFGAFVDIGVHQDGLVHISAMASTFVKDPRAVAKPGDIVRVKVLEVDQARKRIALTMRLDDDVTREPRRGGSERQGPRSATPQASRPPQRQQPSPKEAGGALADALRRAGLKGGNEPRR
ncbi:MULTISPECIES: Tex family protein [unclassified Chelatococcus]|uniref:Tex family protein n=1 Tax=unclassified Chelatococcus TaxID=2638111 RepID=UPI001BCDB794|nr:MULTISPECIES: Tex family protein [unclassified Chelatococcus]MBS7699222.1 RNA-binding transcriptional accessory protein [Chelatococcus sp. YT9]MBX3555003.1 RNA-binding transcriptional accessory protein [Chelatococcus sp.]